jgi:hypothetical protein
MSKVVGKMSWFIAIWVDAELKFQDWMRNLEISKTPILILDRFQICIEHTHIITHEFFFSRWSV